MIIMYDFFLNYIQISEQAQNEFGQYWRQVENTARSYFKKKTFIVFTYSFPMGGSAYHSTHAEAKGQLIDTGSPLCSLHNLGQSTGMELKFESLTARAWFC